MIAKRLFRGPLALTYILFQLFRLASLVWFVITLLDCKWNTDDDSSKCLVYYKWDIVRLTCSILTSIICICLLNQKVLPELRPVAYTVVLKCLFLKPYFWSLSGMTVLATTCNIILWMQLIKEPRQGDELSSSSLSSSSSSLSSSSLCLLTFSRLMTLYVIYQLNFTYPPSKAKGFRFTSIAGYFITLSIFYLNNLWDFVAVSVHIASEVTAYDVESKLLNILSYLIIMVINASLCNTFLQFFWLKIFRGDKDILSVYKQNLAETYG